jgi:polyisoprenoid-binding protein YceI
MAKKTTWAIDGSHSSVEFAVTHKVLTTVGGRFKKLNGTIQVNEEDADRSSVEVDIDAASIDTGTLERDQQLRSADFLDVENFPTIVFQSKQVEGAQSTPGERFRIGGNLIILGRSVFVTLDASFNGLGEDPWGHRRAGFSASTQIDRRDWGLEWNEALEADGALVGHTVKVQVDVEAVEQEASGKAAA